jgi:predicted GNAT superfamily acetyltransferase
VQFEIDKDQQQAVFEAGKRGSIHAYITGLWSDVEVQSDKFINYDPLRFPYFFYIDTLEPITSASYVRFDRNGVSVVLESPCQDQVT